MTEASRSWPASTPAIETSEPNFRKGSTPTIENSEANLRKGWKAEAPAVPIHRT